MSTMGMLTRPRFNMKNVMDDIGAALYVMQPNSSSPIFSMISAMGQSEPLTDITTTWAIEPFSVPLASVAIAVPAVSAMTVSDITVVSDAPFVPYSMLQNSRTMEIMRVTEIRGKVLTVVRGHGSSAPQPMLPGDTLVDIGTAVEEASVRVTARSSEFTTVSNQAQIIRAAWAVSNTARAIKTRFKDAESNTRLACAADYARKFEATLLLSELSTTNVNGQQLRTTDGVLAQIKKYAPSNLVGLGNVVSQDSMEEALAPMFAWRSDGSYFNDRMAYCSLEGIKLITALGRASGQSQLTAGQTAFGHRFTKMMTAVGEVNFVHHAMMDFYPQLKHQFLLLDPASIKIRYLQGRKQIENMVGVNGLHPETGMDAAAGDLLSEALVQVTTPMTNGVIGFSPNWDIGTRAVVAVGGLYTIELTSADECIADDLDHVIDPNTKVTITATGGKPATVLTLITPSGVIEATVNAAGVATWTVKVDDRKQWTAYVQLPADSSNMVVTKAGVSFCIKQPCPADPLTVDPCSP